MKELKSGAARLARTAKVPLIPMAVWGPHRLWTKGHKKELTKRHVPVIISIGEPIEMVKGMSPDATTEILRERLSALLDAAQKAYPEQPAGPDDRWWLPAHMGGTAPLPERSRRRPSPRRRRPAETHRRRYPRGEAAPAFR